jgi:hypothetical protein
MSVSEPFIRRPVATELLALAILLAGALGYVRLPVASLPDIDFPTIQVTTSLPGAEPTTMASSVAEPLERRIGEIAGTTQMTSTSSLGQTVIVVQFDLARTSTKRPATCRRRSTPPPPTCRRTCRGRRPGARSTRLTRRSWYSRSPQILSHPARSMTPPTNPRRAHFADTGSRPGGGDRRAEERGAHRGQSRSACGHGSRARGRPQHRRRRECRRTRGDGDWHGPGGNHRRERSGIWCRGVSTPRHARRQWRHRPARCRGFGQERDRERRGRGVVQPQPRSPDHRFQAARQQHRRYGGCDRPGDAAVEGVDAGRNQHLHPDRRHRHDPRQPRRRADDADDHRRSGGDSGLPVPPPGHPNLCRSTDGSAQPGTASRESPHFRPRSTVRGRSASPSSRSAFHSSRCSYRCC